MVTTENDGYKDIYHVDGNLIHRSNERLENKLSLWLNRGMIKLQLGLNNNKTDE